MRATISSPLQPVKVSSLERITWFSLALSFIVCFCLGTDLSLWFQTWQGSRARSANLLEVAMGDARRMFANHFFVKADAYFHSGFYPTIYDNQQSFQTPHIAEDSGAMAGKNKGDETTFLGKPRNWIDRFGREFFPSVHTHLTEGGADGKEHEAAVREILPWMKLSSELDPKRVQTYVVTSYWLRRIGKPNEAAEFLREGLKENPGDPQLLFELGRLYSEVNQDADRARNIWEAALRNLDGLSEKKDADKFVEEQILASLAKLEEKANRPVRAIALLEKLKAMSPNPEAIEKWINDLRTSARVHSAPGQ